MEPIKAEAYYYYRDTEKKPIITVCLLKAEQAIGKGIAICSDLDSPCKRTGRQIAKGRAIQALVHRITTQPVNRIEALTVLWKANPLIPQFINKTIFNPSLKPFEIRMLNRQP